MMGPLPISSIRLMSSRLGISWSHLSECGAFDPPRRRTAHAIDLDEELLEEIVAVVRPGRGFGMVLHRERGPLLEAQTFDRSVVQVSVGHGSNLLADRILRDRKAVVLRRNLDFARDEILDGMVGSAMAHKHFVHVEAAGQGHELMAETYTEHRNLRLEGGFDFGDVVGHGPRIAGTVREEEPIRLPGENLVQRRRGWEYADAASTRFEGSQDVELYAVVQHRDARTAAERVVEGLPRGNP